MFWSKTNKICPHKKHGFLWVPYSHTLSAPSLQGPAKTDRHPCGSTCSIASCTCKLNRRWKTFLRWESTVARKPRFWNLRDEEVALPLAKIVYNRTPKLWWNSSVWARINSADLKQKVEKLGSLQTHQNPFLRVLRCSIFREHKAAGTESVCCFVFVSVEFHHRFVCVCLGTLELQ
jgi:hypothetical protein